MANEEHAFSLKVRTDETPILPGLFVFHINEPGFHKLFDFRKVKKSIDDDQHPALLQKAKIF